MKLWIIEACVVPSRFDSLLDEQMVRHLSKLEEPYFMYAIDGTEKDVMTHLESVEVENIKIIRKTDSMIEPCLDIFGDWTGERWYFRLTQVSVIKPLLQKNELR